MTEFTTIQIKKETVKVLEQMKSHPRQGMADLIEQLVNAYIEQTKQMEAQLQ